MASGSYKRVLLALAIATAMMLMVSGCSGSSSSGTSGGATTGGTSSGGASGGATVVEQNFQFSPTSLTVKVGDKVTFDNQDTVPHHVYVGTVDLGEQAPGKSVTWTADKDGTFPFRCSIHPSMIGQITVGAGGASGGSGAPTGGGSSAPPAGGYGY